jgi:hypothetical protein
MEQPQWLITDRAQGFDARSFGAFGGARKSATLAPDFLIAEQPQIRHAPRRRRSLRSTPDLARDIAVAGAQFIIGGALRSRRHHGFAAPVWRHAASPDALALAREKSLQVAAANQPTAARPSTASLHRPSGQIETSTAHRPWEPGRSIRESPESIWSGRHAGPICPVSTAECKNNRPSCLA